MADKKDPMALTTRELEILSKAWPCLKNDPEMDYAKLAKAVGMTNTGSAVNAWAKIKKKLWSDGVSTPGKKRGASAEADVDSPTPSKKKLKRAGGKKLAKGRASEEDEEADIKEEKSDLNDQEDSFDDFN